MSGPLLGPVLRGGTLAALVLAVAALVLPRAAGTVAGWAALAVVVAAPLLRVVALVVGWAAQADRRFAAAGLALLAVVAAGAGLPLLLA